ncbi:MAG: 9-O-acetylesterase [Fuerstiella sp.]
MKRNFLLLLLLAFLTVPVEAEVRLPGFFTDHMVLQRDKEIRLWGWAEPGEEVTVRLGEAQVQTVGGEDGRWQALLPAMAAHSDGLTLTVSGKNSIQLKDVLVGEVWLCSGQSNMEWSVARSSNAAEEIASANHPLIRHVKIPRRPSSLPLDDVEAEWEICSPETVADFTACGYFMARRLQKELDVPIGLINSSWGGTRVEPWTPPIGFQKVPALRDIYQAVQGRTPGTEAFEQSLSQHIDALEVWLLKAKAALKQDAPIEPQPTYPDSLKPYQSHQDPTRLYNGMIHPLVGYPLRGAIWYQGESNHAEGMLYFEKKKALINGWREIWGQGDFPFYYVQIAPFQYGNEDPTILPRFWEAQAAVQQLKNTGMVVINDIATLNDIHPPNKQDVGTRLANLALKNDYGSKDLVARSPEWKSMQRKDGRLILTFEHTGGGLKTRDGQPPTHFEIIGPDSNGYQEATAKIDGDTVVLSSEKVNDPSAFRFAWHKLAEPNLTGGTGLPVGAVKGGKPPAFVDTLPLDDKFKLVYDLNLNKLGANIRYDVDESANVGEFETVAYLLELHTGSGEAKTVFVTAEAFTSDASKIGIPTSEPETSFQQRLSGVHVSSNVADVKTGTVQNANIEFWPHNYSPSNSSNVPGASSSVYDFGDSPGAPVAGYGCMQIHNIDAKQTIFAVNHWRAGKKADVGIGNSEGQTRDWTFSGNADGFPNKRLRIYVR